MRRRGKPLPSLYVVANSGNLCNIVKLHIVMASRAKRFLLSSDSFDLIQCHMIACVNYGRDFPIAQEPAFSIATIPKSSFKG